MINFLQEFHYSTPNVIKNAGIGVSNVADAHLQIFITKLLTTKIR